MQASLATAIPTVKALMPYLPVLAPSVGVTDPATSQTSYSDLDAYCLATRIDFRVKRLAQDADLTPDRPDATDIVPPSPGNAGSPARALAPFAYEIIGPNPGDAVLLERLLTAMASEGEAMLSGLFLSYADANNGAAGLTSRAASEFLAFIVQSNLSTETNPPAAFRLAALGAAAAPTGIANQPAEFIKLLWELSTVNSAGTYLFYQLLADGAGLPPALFDQNGIATLTLIVTISRSDALTEGARVFNAVNALVSTAPIDPDTMIVELKGVSCPTPGLPLAADATLAATAAFYGLDLGGVASSNAGALLTAGRRIPVSGLYHQLLPADVAPGLDPLQALAAYYSVGAVTPLSKADVAAFNPGVPVAALSVFRIPPFAYAVAASGPGNSLASMAAYYATELAGLAYAARDVAGLFQSSALTINPVLHDAMPRLGLGNAAIAVQRERGLPPVSNPTHDDIAAYTHATLLQLYQLFSAGIAANAFFKASVDSAAFGPKDPPPSNPGAGVRRLGGRLAAIAPDQPYLYDQALGFGAAAVVNAAPAPAVNGLPLAAANPYVGIGSILQMRLAWQDLFGNRTPNPFSHPQPGDPPPFGDVPMALLYADRLMPLDQWPSTTRAYRYGGAAGSPVLTITLAFDPTPYEPAATAERRHLNAVRFGDDRPVWQRNAAADLAKLELVYFQLVQDYSGLGIPGLIGRAVGMSIVNSLLTTPEAALPDGAQAAVLGYVDAAILYLAARAAGIAAAAPPPVLIPLPIALDQLAIGDIIALQVSLRFTRAANLVDPVLRALADGCTVASVIPVASGPAKPPVPGDAPSYPVSLTQFATDMEAAFVTVDWQMRVGAGSSDPAAPGNARAPTIWAIRMAVTTSVAPKGIGFLIGGDARHFAPLPIASSLQTLTADIQRYRTGAPYPDGAPLTTTFASVDPNVWLADCLGAVDDALSASYSTPMFLLDRLLGLAERPTSGVTPGYLARMLAHKRTLAAAIASTATSVLDQPANGLQPAAAATLEQALLRRLGNAAALTCVTVLPVTKANYGPPSPAGATPPRLFGQPQGTLAGGVVATANSNFALSSAKIPLSAVPEQDTSTLAFLFTSRSAATDAYVDLKLSFALSHIEHDIHGVPGIERYEQSRWITFLTGPFDTPIRPATGDSFAIPVALRALPVPATVVAQAGTQSGAQIGTASAVISPADLRTWDYSFSYLLQQAAQDTVMAEIVFNQDAASLAAPAAAPTAALYAALAQFVAIYPAVARDLESFLRPINGRSDAGSAEVAAANDAVGALETVVAGVAKAYDDWAAVHRLAAFIVPPAPKIVYRFEILLKPTEDAVPLARLAILPQSFERNGAATANFLSLAKLLIDPDNYDPVLVDSDPKTGAVTWRYALRPDAKNPNLPPDLPFAAALLDAARAVRFEGLDLFALQNGWASVEVMRNGHLSPDLSVQTTPAFQFATAAARFADPLVPLLDTASFALDAAGAGPAPVADWLATFFKGLLSPAPATGFSEPVLVKLETRYSYSLVPGGGAAGVPATTIPISLLAPTSTEGSAEPPFVAAVGAFAQDWFDRIAPITDSPAGFEFGLTVFAGGGSNLPLLRVGSLTLAAVNVKPG